MLMVQKASNQAKATTLDCRLRRGEIKRHLKLAISLGYFTKQVLARSLRRALGKPHQPQLIILYYHGVPNRLRSRFARQLDKIQSKAKVFPASHRGCLSDRKPSVAITFDDAYLSVAENALPELTARGLHSTIFVPARLLGRQPNWTMEEGSPDSEEIIMPAEMIASLPSPLVSLGSHTCTHPRLSRIDPAQAREEIAASRSTLEELTAQDIRLLAFPYGDHNSLVVELCKEAGYDIVFSTIPYGVDTLGSEFVRGRVKVDPFDSRLEFYLKYNGAYAWIPYASFIKRKLRL
jgi:peptidoglycan/xylan/chitin deacetylase (PgdA/CDA1 family)